MSQGGLSAVVQLVIALIASGLMVKLLTVRQDRRKIAGDASTAEANAASTLSGAAMAMVEAAQTSARDAERKAATARAENDRLWVALNRTQWRVYHLEEREHELEILARDHGVAVPPRKIYELEDVPPPPGATDYQS
jgi:hypothetical protein